ncbi:oxygen-independent coproporphyrinogen III oxidase [Subsaximicrobium wynnwilliamsii]|uniref:Coproporphyrinogen-III oxidase n=1 Tax=Subsaximicrobium wynnwilliamsii TaxID=291179 RepID=A0A5C6ZJK5_9FLAO|nr:oxygen-independent coproporphyrinogen III oxidase [Subsaximicrobium wynnwilliamsii]TXD83076.1 oxygen-independent coproporphyrinogen III oxidase [Subsaximicrobium wynnwilliamsii]TXD88820.1 oxygen-independent coproporphyrinogen III oxidase [Subsaximicrobium wynnwilliamsii]TXE02893.1 oxygen-independent coproporphyrinogen III oxidase [Subsaximicrobium wynnwilliamsii]
MNKTLIKKYNIPGPRYTSYPTVPFWDLEAFTKDLWMKSFKRSFIESNSDQGISLYIHLPFCESLCTFCACHKHITKRHGMEDPYIKTVLKEWDLYVNEMPEKPVIKEIHLGGGTPTFFSSENLSLLIKGILEPSVLHADYEFSFEGHPNNTTKEQLQALYDLGFTRVSYGIQDYDPKVQAAIHRLQTFEQVEKVTQWSREIGYTSISHDLIFGLPFQTLDSIKNSIEKTKSLLPDRISFYSYAHVPWVKGVGQRGFDEADIPKDDEKRALYETGKQMFLDLGYEEIGMDHFALKSDQLYKAMKNQTLHRNFMGYTTNTTQLMIGLGMSAISDSWYGFAQNVKTVKEYEALVASGEIPVFKGHLLSEEDLIIRQHILNIMCQLETAWEEDRMAFPQLASVLDSLKEAENDGIVHMGNERLTIPEAAKPFIRNICMAFDLKLHQKQSETQIFSMTI